MKKITAIILCAAMIIAIVPSAVFATDKPDNYVEIKVKEGCSDRILVGETSEIYVEYATDCEEFELVWHIYGNACDSYEYVTDSETGMVTGIKINGVSAGLFNASVKMVDSHGNTLDIDIAEIRITEPDTRTEEEKLQEKFEDFKLSMTMGLYMFVIMPVVSLLAVPVLAVMKLLGLPPW